MKQKKIKVIAMVLSLFAACGGISSAMETSKSGENSKVNSKSGQNKNKTQNNKPQSNGKRNENSCVQIPYYAYPVGYLGLNEVGNLLGFNYLLFGRCGIIKGAKYLLFDGKVKGKKNETKNEVKKGPYWQHNYNMFLQAISVANCHEFAKDLLRHCLGKLMGNSSEKFLLDMLGIAIYKFNINVNSFVPIRHFGTELRGLEYYIDKDKQKLDLTEQVKNEFGVSKGNSWVEVLFDNLRGNEKVSKAKLNGETFDFEFDQDNVKFGIGIDAPLNIFHKDEEKDPNQYQIVVKKTVATISIHVQFRVPVWLYSE